MLNSLRIDRLAMAGCELVEGLEKDFRAGKYCTSTRLVTPSWLGYLLHVKDKNLASGWPSLARQGLGRIREMVDHLQTAKKCTKKQKVLELRLLISAVHGSIVVSRVPVSSSRQVRLVLFLFS